MQNDLFELIFIGLVSKEETNSTSPRGKTRSQGDTCLQRRDTCEEVDKSIREDRHAHRRAGDTLCVIVEDCLHAYVRAEAETCFPFFPCIIKEIVRYLPQGERDVGTW